MPSSHSSFPFLSPGEFRAACVSLEERYQSRLAVVSDDENNDENNGGWKDVRVYERVCSTFA